MWRFERRTFKICHLGAKLILACQEVIKWVWPPMNRYRMVSVQTSTRTPSMHWKLNKHGQVCLQNKQLPTKTPVELENRGAHIQDFMMWFQQLLFLHYNFAYGTLWWYTLEYNNIGASTYHALGWALWNFHRGHANDTIYRSTILASCHWCIGPIYSPEVAVLLRQQLHTKNRATHLRSFVINCQWIKWHPTLSPCYNIT